jgi:hypothetical protein
VIDRLVATIGALAVLAALIVVVLGAVNALIENDYDAADYLEDLKALLIGLAAVLIALELPNSIRGHLHGRDEETL